MIEISPTVLIIALGTYTTTLVGCIMWLNTKFFSIESSINSRVSQAAYDVRHADLEQRLRNLEIQLASRVWNHNHP